MERFLVLFLVSFNALADEAAAQPDILDKALAMLGGLNGPILIGVAAVVEIGFRLIKSEKPLSIAHAISLGLGKIAKLCQSLGDLLDKVLPQRLK